MTFSNCCVSISIINSNKIPTQNLMINDKGDIFFQSPRGKSYGKITAARAKMVNDFFTTNPQSLSIWHRYSKNNFKEVDSLYEISRDRCKIILNECEKVLDTKAESLNWQNSSLTSLVHIKNHTRNVSLEHKAKLKRASLGALRVRGNKTN